MRRAFICVALAVTATSGIAWVRQTSSLYIGGSLASSNVFMHNGQACVPVHDIATALKLTVQKTGRGIELTDAGGANQATGINGKIGDVLWNGYLRFQVIKVIRTKSYTNQFSGDNRVVTPDKPSDDIVVVVCRISNGLKNGATVMYPGGDTGITDDQGQSYSPELGLNADIASRGADLLPGAAFNFALTFEVPSTAVIGDLVYQATMGGPGTNGVEKKKFRVSLKQ